MSADELDLDAVVARSQQAQNVRSGMAPANRPAQAALWTLCREDVPALVAEVRRLRAAISQQGRSACGERAPYGSDVCERPPMHPGEHRRAGHWWSLR